MNTSVVLSALNRPAKTTGLHFTATRDEYEGPRHAITDARLWSDSIPRTVTCRVMRRSVIGLLSSVLLAYGGAEGLH